VTVISYSIQLDSADTATKLAMSGQWVPTTPIADADAQRARTARYTVAAGDFELRTSMPGGAWPTCASTCAGKAH
jgi:hypothetical protein